nr:glycosyltransferase family 2 protein [Rhizobium skierniewicense]
MLSERKEDDDVPPKFSIITPSLNQGRFLKQCLASVQIQNWPDLEHFVIDGGSQDETLQILTESRSQLTAYVSEPDSGAADAINKGLAMATGDIVAWINADDYYAAGAFEKIAEAWRCEPDAPFWFGNGERVDEAGNFKSPFNDHPILYDHRALIEGTDYILQPSTFMNGKVLRQIGGLNTALRWSFDWELFIRLAEQGQPVALDDSLSSTREWGETLTATGSLKRIEEIRVMIERRSGKPLTYGTLCYHFDATLKEMQTRPEDFSARAIYSVENAWRAIQQDMMDNLPVDAGGMPRRPEQAEKYEETPTPGIFMRAARRGLRLASRLRER